MAEVIDKFDGTKYRFLSNFYMHPVMYEGILYPSSEHAYQAAKTLDPVLRKVIANMRTPGETKKAGRRLALRDNWDNIKNGIMLDIVRIKFQDKILANRLVATFPAELIEGNTWGDVWFGVCNGIGHNHLGKILMLVRDELMST